MKRNGIILIFLFFAFASFQMMAQPGGPSKNAPTPSAHVVVLSQAESFEFLKNLNENEKIFPESYMLPLTAYKDLKPEGCFGVRLSGGLRLVGESSGKNAGVHGSLIGTDGKKESYALTGVFYAEFPFSIQGKLFPAGPYVVQAYRTAMELVGDDVREKHYDMNRRKQVPKERTEKFLLKTSLTEALLEEKTVEVPRFSISVNKGVIVLTLHGNSWRIIPTKS
jgi:hypothetical protein